MTYVRTCLACGGALLEGQNIATVRRKGGGNSYRHRLDEDCQAAMRGYVRARTSPEAQNQPENQAGDPLWFDKPGDPFDTSRHVREGGTY